MIQPYIKSVTECSLTWEQEWTTAFLSIVQPLYLLAFVHPAGNSANQCLVKKGGLFTFPHILSINNYKMELGMRKLGK